jgi:tyrosyl-tRNA synthetase
LSKLRSTTSSTTPQESVLRIDDIPDALPKSFSSKFLQTLLERGYIHQCTDFKGLDEKCSSQGIITAYLGFDATAKSLHVGSLLQIMILRHLQKSGHKPIVLIGGGTTKVGDPSGKDESRQLLTEEIIQNNANSLSQVFRKYITFGNGPCDAIMVNNADWLDNIKYLDFLRDYGRYFTINRMLSFESVKLRLSREQPLSFLEFNYMLLQAYDFLELNRRYKAILQLGGSDQWGNIISGVELGRKVDQTQLFGLTAPLLTTSEGKKMGKTADGAVWLDKTLLSEFDYWQFWRNTADADVIRFLKLFTEVSMEEIRVMETWEGSQLNTAKVILADEATRMLHGEECLTTIKATAQSLFGGGSEADLDSLPKFTLNNQESSSLLQEGKLTIVDILIKSQMASSKSEARRLITGGGARVNNEKVVDENAVVKSEDFDALGRLKISSGKKKHALVVKEQ